MFRDRKEAGQRLARELEMHKQENAIVLAIPRGGVPVGFEISKQLKIPLELALSKKIGAPFNKEYAIGSVTLFGYIITDPIFTSEKLYIEEEVKRIQEDLIRRYRKFKGNKLFPNLSGKTVIITDDGIATGSTIRALIETLNHNHKPKRVIIAVPVGPSSSVKKLGELVDEVVCLETPAFFYGVGQFYQEFDQVDDQEVADLLHQAELFPEHTRG